ncbi:MAG TPA: alpha/beta-hydrolase family protein [Aldersonia sp.]
MNVRPPTVAATVVTTAMILVSLAPGLLPRPALTQAVFSGALVALGLATTAIVRRHSPHNPQRAQPPFLIGAAAVIATTALAAAQWQNGLRETMGVSTVGWAHWGVVAIGTVAVAAGLSAVARALRWVIGFLRRSRFGIPTLVVLALLAASTRFAAVIPTSADTLGPQGERFVSGGTSSSTRVYVGVDAAPDPAGRAALAVEQLDRTGALRQPNLVIAVPTGSGWIDENAATGLERRFGGAVAIVGVQYSTAPSWVGFLFDRATATESARAVFDAVAARVAQLPADRRPTLYVYGQSLGALGGAGVFRDGADQDRRTCAVLWAGPPAGAVPAQGATVLANRSDPVVWWSPRLLVRPPDLAATRSDAPIPPWIPLVGFLQTSVDLLGALDAPAGHGHRYGLDQGTAMGACGS